MARIAIINKLNLCDEISDEEVEEFIRQRTPPIEPSNTLDEWIWEVLDWAFPDGCIEPIFLFEESEDYYAESLLNAVEKVWEKTEITEEPWFSKKDMQDFILAWRGRVMTELTG